MEVRLCITAKDWDHSCWVIGMRRSGGACFDVCAENTEFARDFRIFIAFLSLITQAQKRS